MNVCDSPSFQHYEKKKETEKKTQNQGVEKNEGNEERAVERGVRGVERESWKVRGRTKVRGAVESEYRASHGG